MRNYQKIRNGYCYANKKSRLYDTMYVYIYIYNIVLHEYAQ